MLHDVAAKAKRALDKTNETNFEKFFNDLPDDDLDNDDIEIINKTLCLLFCEHSNQYQCFETGFENTPDYYDTLIDRLRLDDSWSVVSLNYDVLLEQALTRKNIPYQYDTFSFQFPPKEESGLKIYKPHGSINFRSMYHIARSASESVLDEVKLMPAKHSYTEKGKLISEPPIYYAVKPTPANILHIAHSTELVVMANYRKGKDSLVSYDLLRRIRTNALEAIKLASEVVIIGVKPVHKEDDAFVEEAARCIQAQTTYVTVSSDDAKVFKKFQPEASIIEAGLENFINAMPSLKGL